MREIKFRAWDKEHKRMLPVKQMLFDQWWVSCIPTMVHTKASDILEYGERNSFKNEDTDRHILMQYTGLTDKNGTEIYEGDVVKTTALLNDHHQRGATVVSPVEYWHGATCLSITYVPLSLDFQVSHEIEIIGNIYENAELLK